MKIGFVGLGKLGLPSALAMESRGAEVFGCDPAPRVAEILATRRYPHREAGVDELLRDSRLHLRSLDETLRDADLVFVCLPTPHAPGFEGVTRLGAERRDFDYGPLCAGIEAIAASLERQAIARDVIVVSTVLPGTMRRLIAPRIGRGRLGYNPSFIAMGTIVRDFLEPEFVLFGADDAQLAERARAIYDALGVGPFQRVSIEDAELAKVLYNTFISTKIAFANTAGELAHHLGADIDRVMDVLALGRRRLLSPAYLRAGMGDGGGCHPRDNIALSWLSRSRSLSFDWFDAVMQQRERHTEWLARLTIERAGARPIVVLGKSFKAECALVEGSPAILLAQMIRELGRAPIAWDPFVDDAPAPLAAPACFAVATMHAQFRALAFPAGSIVIDPWRYLDDRPGVEVVRVGAGPALAR